jgi:hypothetical protein
MRAERRQSFVEFLEAYDTAYGKSQVLLSSHRASRAEGSSPNSDWIAEAPDEMGRLERAFLVLSITSGDEVRGFAEQCLQCIWSLGKAAAASREDLYHEAIRAAQSPRNALRMAMQEELTEVWTPHVAVAPRLRRADGNNSHGAVA